jgi:hypothetical protein
MSSKEEEWQAYGADHHPVETPWNYQIYQTTSVIASGAETYPRPVEGYKRNDES